VLWLLLPQTSSKEPVILRMGLEQEVVNWRQGLVRVLETY
jgi:hypothetical protein